MEEPIADAAEVESTDSKSQLINGMQTTGVRMPQDFAPITLAAVGAVIIGLLLVLIQWGSPVLVPVLMAGYIAALCLPIYSWLLGRGMRKSIALVIMLLVVLVGIAAIGLLLIAGVDRVRAGLSDYSPGLNSELPAIQAALTDLGVNESSVDVSLNSEAVTSFLSSFLGAIAGVLGDLFFSLILVAFFLLEVERFFDLAETKLKDRPIFGQAPVIAKTAVTYFGIRTRLNLVTGVLIGIALVLLGVDYAILWGLLAFILSYIPYIGLFTAMIPPTILAFAEYGLTRAILVIIVALGVNLLIENILEPTYTGAKLRLSPTIVFLSFFLWAWLLGPIGALLSMPITVMILLALDQHESTRWAARIMGSVRD